MDQGKQLSLTFTATAPTLGVVSSPLQPHHQHPNSAVLACWGKGAGRGRDACHNYWEKVGQRRQEEQGSLRPRVPIIHPHAISILAGGEIRGIPFSPSHPPTPNFSLGPWFLLGRGPTPCANGVGHSGMSREPGEAGSAHSGWNGEEGVHMDTSDERDG